MTQENEELLFIITQFVLTDTESEFPTIHPKKKDKRQGSLIKEMDDLIHEYTELDVDIDLTPYQDAVKLLRKIKGKEAYEQFIDDLLAPYH